MNEFEKGVLLGILVGEGHFGGDGRQGQITLRMHTRHGPLLEWMRDRVPGSRLYGPYHHGGRSYFQWMARGEVLQNVLVPLLKSLPWGEIDPHTRGRFQAMLETYLPAAL